MKKKVLSVFLILSLLLCILPYGHAESVQPRYSHVFTIAAGIELNGSSLWCFGEGSGLFDDTYTRLSVRAQRMPEDGGSWSAFHRWSGSASGVRSAVVDDNITVSPGYYYRLYVIVQIFDNDGNMLENVNMYSSTVHYPSTNP